jgi:hypothetical protein
LSRGHGERLPKESTGRCIPTNKKFKAKTVKNYSVVKTKAQARTAG